MEQRLTRLEQINALIKYIGEMDKNRYRPTLHRKNNNGLFEQGYFVFKENGLLYYIDSYTKMPIRPMDSAHSQRDRCFSEGGNMWELIKSFGTFIMTGEKGHLRDYKEIWAFDFENTMKVRKMAKEIGFIETVDYPHALYSC